MSQTNEAPKLFMVSKTMFILADDKTRIRSSTIDNAFGSVDAEISELRIDDEILKGFDSDTACYDVSTHDGREVQTLLEAAELIQSVAGQKSEHPASPVTIEPSPVESPEKWLGDLTEEQQREHYKQGKLIPVPPKAEWAIGEWYRAPLAGKPKNFFVHSITPEGQATLISELTGLRSHADIQNFLQNSTHLARHEAAESQVPWLKMVPPSVEAQSWLKQIGGQWQTRKLLTGEEWRATLSGVPIALPPVFEDE